MTYPDVGERIKAGLSWMEGKVDEVTIEYQLKSCKKKSIFLAVSTIPLLFLAYVQPESLPLACTSLAYEAYLLYKCRKLKGLLYESQVKA